MHQVVCFNEHYFNRIHGSKSSVPSSMWVILLSTFPKRPGGDNFVQAKLSEQNWPYWVDVSHLLRLKRRSINCELVCLCFNSAIFASCRLKRNIVIRPDYLYDYVFPMHWSLRGHVPLLVRPTLYLEVKLIWCWCSHPNVVMLTGSRVFFSFPILSLNISTAFC